MGRNKIIILGLLVGLLASLVFMSGCMQTEEGGATFDWTWIVFLVLMVGVFYFILIRPQQKRQKQHKQLIDELKRGDRVITAGGIYGQVDSVSDDNVLVKVESGATIRVAKGSVSIKQGE